MSVETLIQSAIVRVDIAIVAAWQFLEVALPVTTILLLTAVVKWRRLRRRR